MMTLFALVVRAPCREREEQLLWLDVVRGGERRRLRDQRDLDRYR